VRQASTAEDERSSTTWASPMIGIGNAAQWPRERSRQARSVALFHLRVRQALAHPLPCLASESDLRPFLRWCNAAQAVDAGLRFEVRWRSAIPPWCTIQIVLPGFHGMNPNHLT
jgi:hypothetical protein